MAGKTLGHYEILEPLGQSMHQRHLNQISNKQRHTGCWQTCSCVLLSLVIAASAAAQTEQVATETPYVVRFGTYGIEVWQFAGLDTGLERIWNSQTVVSEEFVEEWTRRGLLSFASPMGVVADLDDDGTNELGPPDS